MAHKNKSNLSPMKSHQGSRHKKPKQIFTLNEANDRLQDIFRNHEFSHITHEQRLKLAHFYCLLMANQEKENMTRLLTLRDVAIRHFIDCLIVPQFVDLQFPLLDIGTGPGFPGIPLKILFPEKRIILAEGVQRRVEFLKKVREELKLPKLDIIGRNINPYFAYPVQGVITRAVEDIRNTLLNTLTCLQTGGCVYFMKGPNVDPEIPLAEKEVGEYFKLEKDIAYTLPHTEHHRRLLVYRKIKMAPLPDFDEEPWPGENVGESDD
ncbi:MAG: hypothetical protein BroJett040_10950 [Oligoflexia bacterium]|nr:MAG: hypothetical protein BroJett040_10950 [Oligoflexia bacterium]